MKLLSSINYRAFSVLVLRTSWRSKRSLLDSFIRDCNVRFRFLKLNIKMRGKKFLVLGSIQIIVTPSTKKKSRTYTNLFERFIQLSLTTEFVNISFEVFQISFVLTIIAKNSLR